MILKDIMATNQNDEIKYRLDVNSTKKESAEVIKKDGTASKFSIEHQLIYSLHNLEKKCEIYEKEITTIINFSSKAAGYSFGTDFSKKESIEKNINKNIRDFISGLNSLANFSTCKK